MGFPVNAEESAKGICTGVYLGTGNAAPAIAKAGQPTALWSLGFRVSEFRVSGLRCR